MKQTGKLFLFLMSVMAFPVLVWSSDFSADTEDCNSLFKSVTAQNRNPSASTVRPVLSTLTAQALQQLAHLRIELDRLQVERPTPLSLVLESDYYHKLAELTAILAQEQGWTEQQVLAQVWAVIQQILQLEPIDNTAQVVAEAEETQEQKSALSNYKINGDTVVMNPVQPGIFQMSEGEGMVLAEIEQTFALAATETTQKVWKKVTQVLRQEFPDDYDWQFSPEPSKFDRDELRPVEQVSFITVNLWIDGLNRLAAMDHPVVREVLPFHQPGRIYRLPSNKEWEFVARNRGRANGLYTFGDDDEQLKQHACYSANAGSKTRAVAAFLPHVVDGYEFFDLHGNVSELVTDAKGNPMDRGGAWCGFATHLYISDASGEVDPDFKGDTMGFRLACSL